MSIAQQFERYILETHAADLHAMLHAPDPRAPYSIDIDTPKAVRAHTGDCKRTVTPSAVLITGDG